MKTAGGNCFLDRKNRRQRLVFDDDLGGGGATSLLRLSHHQRNDLAVIKRFLVREQNLIVPHRADIVQTGNIFGQQHGRDAGHRARGRGIASQNPGVRMRRADRPDFQHLLRLRDVVDVNRFAGDMLVPALVRRRVVFLREVAPDLAFVR